MSRVVFAAVDTPAQLRQTIDALLVNGFARDDISVIMPKNLHDHHIAHDISSKAPEGAVAGGIAGGVTGGVIGVLAGLGALAIPGLGMLVAAGPLFGLLSGIGAGGAVGGITGGLIGLGLPEIEAKRYEERLREGAIIISVHCESSDEVSTAKEVLRDCEAEKISTGSEA